MLNKIKQFWKWFVSTMLDVYEWDERWFILSIFIFGILPVSPVYISAVIHGDMLFRFVGAYAYTLIIMLVELIIWLYGTGEGKKIWRELKSKEKKQN